jgi:hypothetical protein
MDIVVLGIAGVILLVALVLFLVGKKHPASVSAE